MDRVQMVVDDFFCITPSGIDGTVCGPGKLLKLAPGLETTTTSSRAGMGLLLLIVQTIYMYIKCFTFYFNQLNHF